jgi:hypothetical protein
LFFFRYRFDKEKLQNQTGKRKENIPKRAFKKIKKFCGLEWKELRIGAV